MENVPPAPEHPQAPAGEPAIVIEYSDAAMEAIRAAVMEGLYKLAHSGLEVGGLLLGELDGGTVRILDSRPIACEHAQGPSFLLSARDEETLDAQLSSLRAAPESSGMRLVGWYRSNNRGGIRLTERDRVLWFRCCPEPWQVALVLHPERMKPTKAGFFLRPAGGWAGDESPCFAFEITPLARTPRPVSAPELPAPELAPAHAEPVDAPPPVTAAPRRAGFWFLFALAWCIAAASLAFGLREFWLPARVPPLSLRLLDSAGQLLVQWNRSDPHVLQARSGTLEITDGGKRSAYQLDAAQARGGSFTYLRGSGDVAVLLRLALPRGQTAGGASRFAAGDIPKPAAALPPAAVPEPGSLAGKAAVPAPAANGKTARPARKKTSSKTRKNVG